MAESVDKSKVTCRTNETPVETNEPNTSANQEECIDCAVCLQSCIHPARLPCGHVFCFLCVKGIANQSKRCAICRQEIPRDFVEQPILLQPNIEGNSSSDTFDGGYQWFYEGRNGWWQYDERTSRELEACYKRGDLTCELLIAGFLYVVDFESLLQMRRNDPSRRRQIKRDLATISRKGVAGLRTASNATLYDGGTSADRPVEGQNDSVDDPVTPSNTPQTPISGRESPHQQLDLETSIERIRLLHIDGDP